MDIKVRVVVGILVVTGITGLIYMAYQLGRASNPGLDNASVSVTGEPTLMPETMGVDEVIEAEPDSSPAAEVVENETAPSPTTVVSSVSGKIVFPNLRIKPTATPTPTPAPTIGIKVELRRELEMVPLSSPTAP